MRVVQPPKLVVVRRDGRWYDGELRAWRREVNGWLGFVCYAVSLGIGDQTSSQPREQEAP